MKMEKMNQTTKNEGFSLIEIILSIALIGIVFVSLMNYFSSSIRANNYAKDVEKSSLAAQTVMEELQEFPTIRMIAKEYNGATHANWKELQYAGGGGIGTYTVKSPASYNGSTFTTSDTYYFTRPITVDGTDYDALIKIDSTAYNSPPVSSPAAYNKLDVPQMRDINCTENAILVEDIDKIEVARSMLSNQDSVYVYNQHAMGHYWVSAISEANIRNSMSRKVYIDIQPVYPDQVKIKAVYRYHSSYGHLSDVDIDIYEATLNQASLKSFYYFYFQYKTEEKMEINNNTSAKFDFFFICSNPSGYQQIDMRSESGEPDDDADSIKKVYSNVLVYIDGLGHTEKKMIEEKKEQRYTDVTISIFKKDATWNDDNLLAQIITTRGE